ncbi:MAG: hypothetical protein JSR12_03860 [Bacteroidetes bacterium]|nr:hypothetical protein [Bacteroidota bacterium]
MKFVREHIIFKMLWLIMAIHLLNYSVNISDTQANVVTTESFQQKNTKTTSLTEKFTIKNVIAKYSSNDDTNTFGFALDEDADWHIPYNPFLFNYNTSFFYCSNSFQYNKKYFKNFQPDITPPPPKA